MRALSLSLLRVVFLVAVMSASVGTIAAQRNSNWTGTAGDWFGPADSCGSWDTCTSPGTNPGESGFTDNVFINTPNADVSLNGGAEIANLTLGAGDTLTITASTGFVDFLGSGSATLSNAGSINLTNASSIGIFGTPSPNTLALTILGGGTITLETANNRIGGSGASLINEETIQGQGSIIMGGPITNLGLIAANVNGGTLTVQPNLAGLTNTGMLQASNGGILDLENGGTVLTNTGGTIQASDASTVILGGGTYTGGTLQTVGTGVIETLGGGANPHLNGVTNAGLYHILNAGSSTLEGIITNGGTILIGTNAGGGELFINGNVTLTGPGQVILASNPTNVIGSAVANSQLTNQQTIQGPGTIGDANLTIINQGSIIANDPANALNFREGGFTNLGLVKATNNATLNILSLPFDNQGTLQADVGSTINFNGNSSLANYSGATNTLTGGTYVIAGTLKFTNSLPAVQTNAANITLNGAASQILDELNTDVLARLATNAGSASFTIENGRNFTTSGDFQNSGALIVGNGSTFTTGSAAANNYTQNGALSLTDIQNGGHFITSTYTQNDGTTLIETGGTLTATNLNWNGGTFNVNGTLDPLSVTVCASCTLTGTGTVVANVTSNGIVHPGPLSPLSIAGNYTQNAGGELVIDLGGTGAGQLGVLDVAGNASLNGTLDFTAINGFTPVAGDDFTFLNFGTESGSFRTIDMTGWSCPAGASCSEVFGNGTLSLDISGPQATTPEPRSVLLLGTGLLGFAVYFNRKKMVAKQ